MKGDPGSLQIDHQVSSDPKNDKKLKNGPHSVDNKCLKNDPHSVNNR